MMDLYQEMILDHNKKPRNFGSNDGVKHEGFNPLCGDHYYIYVKIEDNKIIDVKFEGKGCAISKASASMMTEALIGKTVNECKKIISEFNSLLKGDNSSDLGKLKVFQTIWKYPARVKCANLAWHTVKSAIEGNEEVVKTE